MVTSELVRAARALLRWEQKDLAKASMVSLPSIQRLEAKPGPLAAQARTIAAIRSALESAGVEFTNGNRPGVRMSEKFALTEKNHRLRAKIDEAYSKASQSDRSRVEKIIADLPGPAGFSELDWLQILHENLKKRADALGL